MYSAVPGLCLKRNGSGKSVYLIGAYGRKTIMAALIGFLLAMLTQTTSGQSNPST
jgi:hypothetical protein